MDATKAGTDLSTLCLAVVLRQNRQEAYLLDKAKPNTEFAITPFIAQF